MNHFIETMLALFWTGYLILHWWMLRTPVYDGNESNDPLQGELQCITPATK